MELAPQISRTRGCLIIDKARKDRPISIARKDRVAIALALIGLAACQPRVGAPGRVPVAGRAGPAESAYRAPPSVDLAVPASGGRVTLVGRALPGARVRLSAPSGPPMFADAGPDGVWRLILPAGGGPRLLGLAMIDQGRPLQAEGYFALLPPGGVVQLRAGASAVILGDTAAGPRIRAVDYDSRGGAVVSGRATPRGRVEVWVDGAHAGQGAAGVDGRFTVALTGPLTLGEHRLSLLDGAQRVEVDAPLAEAAPLASGPYRARLTTAGWRIDWLTPGGGLQTTLLLSDGARLNQGGRA